MFGFFYARKSWRTHFLTKFNYTNTICGFYIICICYFLKLLVPFAHKNNLFVTVVT